MLRNFQLGGVVGAENECLIGPEFLIEAVSLRPARSC